MCVFLAISLRSFYIAGSLKQLDAIRHLASTLRGLGHCVFDDWTAIALDADARMLAYGKERGWTRLRTLASPIPVAQAKVDGDHIRASTDFILVLPAGRSAHIEFGYALGRGLRVWLLDLEENSSPKHHFDIMHGLMDLAKYAYNEEELCALIMHRVV